MNSAPIFSFVTAFGLGSLITVFCQYWLKRSEKNDQRGFDERKQAYVGLLEAYHRAAVESTDAAAKEFAYWQMRCDLVVPRNVRNAIAEIVSTNDDLEARFVAHENLKAALRADLGVIKETRGSTYYTGKS